jgi:DNA polymerase (family 10)
MPVSNEAVAAMLEEFADLLAIQEANPFRVRAYRNAARTVRGLSRDLGSLIAEGAELSELPGIGADLAAKIREIVRTGRSRPLARLHRDVPHGLETLLELPGLGPKRVGRLFRELNIRSLAQLEKTARSGRLRELAGFGARLERQVLDAIAAHRAASRRWLLDAATAAGEPFVEHLNRVRGVRRAVLAGSCRRGRETVGDLDILVTTQDAAAVIAAFRSYAGMDHVLSAGHTRASAVLKNGMQVDLRVVDEKNFGAALQYLTGSKAHSVRLRALAQKTGLKINEYGVFRGARRVAGGTEASLYAAIGLPYIPPELREDRGEIEAGAAGRLPQLIEPADLAGDLHVHAAGRGGDVVVHARKMGLRYVALVTDASRLRRIPENRADMIQPATARGVAILRGIEVEILPDGKLDAPARLLRGYDLVIGAVRREFRLSKRRQTDRLRKAMDHPCFSILAHPAGRLLLERSACTLDMDAVIRHARQRGCFLELNSDPRRLDLPDTHCQAAKAEGVLVCISSAASAAAELHRLRFGVMQARRGWLEAADVLNTRPLAELRRLLRRTMS